MNSRTDRALSVSTLLFFVGVAMSGCAALTGDGLSDLKPGQCISGNVRVYPPTGIEVIDCDQARMLDYKVVFVQAATGDSYPGNLNSLRVKCASAGGTLIQPSYQTWEGGDRVALCYEPPIQGLQ